MARQHWIMAGGISGCIPSHCDVYRTKEDAIQSAGFVYDDCGGVMADLRKYHYCDRVSGNDYASITPCNCDAPWEHSDSMLTEEEWNE